MERRVVPRRGARIETGDAPVLVKVTMSPPAGGRGSKRHSFIGFYHAVRVAPRRGRGSKRSRPGIALETAASPPAGGRGSKQYVQQPRAGMRESPPAGGRGSKQWWSRRTNPRRGSPPAGGERDKKAALKFIKKLMKRHGCAKKITTDGLRSYGAAMKEPGIADRQEVGRYANNRAENSHQPFRRRERAMLRFRRMKTLQKFSSVHAAFHNHFNQERHSSAATTTRIEGRLPWLSGSTLQGELIV